MSYTRHCDGCGRPESPPHVFTAQETSQHGIRVTVTITVPQDSFWKDVRDVAEHAQMAASRAMSSTLQSRTKANEECPF